MYLSFDEAGTHVGCKSFRLIAAVYDENRETLLGTACSPPVRVLANNDVPTGAAHLQLMMNIPATWAGWATAPEPVEPSFAARFANVMETPTPAKVQRRRARQADSESDEPMTSEDPESIDGATTPMHMAPINPSSPYLTRRRTAAKEIPPAPSPLCVSSGNSPSSLLMEGIVGKTASALDIVSPDPRLQTEGSLAMWLEEEARAVQQSHQAMRQKHSYMITTNHTHVQANYKRPRINSEDANGPLPHSANFEPHFPVLLGPPSVHQHQLMQHHHHQQQQQQQQQHQQHHHQLMQHHRIVDVGGLSSHSAGSHQGSGAMGHQSMANNHSIDDPIAAFVELMMLQTQNTHPPIVELPALSPDDHAVTHHQLHSHAMYQTEKMSALGAAGCMRPSSPLLPLNLPETTTSIATPTPSALDDLFAGIHATFDNMTEAATNDDASFPPSKPSLNPSPYVVNLNVDATVR